MSSCEMDAPFDEGAITLCVDDFSEASLPLVGAGPEAAFNTAAGDIVDGTAVSRGFGGVERQMFAEAELPAFSTTDQSRHSGSATVSSLQGCQAHYKPHLEPVCGGSG